MALYRCAACGSPNVVTDQENDGVKFDYVKGAIGTVVLGAGGAVAGISSKNKLVYKCRDCGVSLSYPLGEPYKSLIDTGVASIAGRQTLNINGFPMSWDTIKSKYPNIENGAADAEIQARAANQKQNKASAVEYLMALWQQDNAKDQVFLKKGEAELDAAQREWENGKKDLEARKNEHLQNAIAEKENQLQLLIAKMNTELAEYQAKIDTIEAEIKQLQAQLAALGFFKFSEKANYKKQISEKTASAEALKRGMANKSAEYTQKIEKKQQEINATQQNLVNKLNVIYSPTESPKDRFARLAKEQAELKRGKFPINSPDVYIIKYYPQLLSFYGKACEEELKDIFEDFFAEMTKLPSVGITLRSISKARRYYSAFLTETMEGAITDRVGTITKMGTMYYEYNGI